MLTLGFIPLTPIHGLVKESWRLLTSSSRGSEYVDVTASVL